MFTIFDRSTRTSSVPFIRLFRASNVLSKESRGKRRYHLVLPVFFDCKGKIRASLMDTQDCSVRALSLSEWAMRWARYFCFFEAAISIRLLFWRILFSGGFEWLNSTCVLGTFSLCCSTVTRLYISMPHSITSKRPRHVSQSPPAGE